MIQTTGTFFERVHRTATITSFRFKAADQVGFLAGQFLKMMFDADNPRNPELNKFLSMSCAPGLDYIEVTKRRSASLFSQRLWDLAAGDRVTIQAPMGRCFYDPARHRQIGFLIGGIGITPVISILEDIQRHHHDTDVVLLYTNRTHQEMAFRDFLDTVRQDNPRIRVVYTLDEEDPVPEGIRSGRITRQLVEECVPDFAQRTMFCYGPGGMVKAMQQLCQELGLPDEQIQAEVFGGY